MAYDILRRTDFRRAGRIWESPSHDRTLQTHLTSASVPIDGSCLRIRLQRLIVPLRLSSPEGPIGRPSLNDRTASTETHRVWKTSAFPLLITSQSVKCASRVQRAPGNKIQCVAYISPLCLASFSASIAAPRAPALSPFGIT